MSTPLQALLTSNDQESKFVARHALPAVYNQLRMIATAKMRGLPSSTLQPTALVHEAYLRALKGDGEFENREHFIFAAARAMRDILVERTRAKKGPKRGANAVHVSLSDLTEISLEEPSEVVFSLNEALSKLEAAHLRAYQLILFRYFVGLSFAECSELLGCSSRTLHNDWRFAQAFLRRHLEHRVQAE